MGCPGCRKNFPFCLRDLFADDSAPFLQLSDQIVELQSVHLRHLYIHQDDIVVIVAHPVQRLFAIAGHIGLVAQLVQDGQGQLLVDGMVFRDEDAKRKLLGEGVCQPGPVFRCGSSANETRGNRGLDSDGPLKEKNKYMYVANASLRFKNSRNKTRQQIKWLP